MSLFGMIAVLAIIISISKWAMALDKARDNRKNKSDEIVGHTSSLEERPAIKQRKTEKSDKPMATPVIPVTPALNPAFLKEEDWSDYDKPAFLRKKNNAIASPEKESQAPAQKSRKPPKQSMAEFKASNRSNKPGPAKEASYEEI